MIDKSQDYWTLKAMQKFGGGFVQKLGEAAFHADSINLQKLKDAFPAYFHEYEEMGKGLQKN